MEKHEALSVLITDEKGRRGTGALFYSKGSEKFYVLTCAHVIDKSDFVYIHMLIPTARDPKEESIKVAKDQFHFSPIDEVDAMGKHTCDIAVIECERGRIEIEPTVFSMHLMTSGEKVKAIGYPQDNDGPLYYQQDCMGGQVERVLENEKFFLIRVSDSFLNQADRESELKGFSGSPLWDEEKLDVGEFVFGGIIAFGYGTNINRGRIAVMQARLFQSLMRQEFGVNIESKIPFIPASEIAPGYEENTTDKIAVRSGWINDVIKQGQTYIDILQLQKAINICRVAIQNSEFNQCQTEEKYRIYSIILEAYRLARDYEEYDNIKSEMHASGGFNEREYLTDAVRYFEEGKDDLAKEYIQKALIKNPDGNEERIMDLAIRLMSDGNADYNEVCEFIGERDQLLIKPKNTEEEASIYHMLAYLFAQKFRNSLRALRCENKAYQISGSGIILEQLGLTYYGYSMRDAYIEVDKDQVNRLKIDHSALDKAREIFLNVLTAGDELWIKGTFRRAGLAIFKCFYFLQDQFRIFKHYQDVIKYFSFHTSEEKRDIQCCYLETEIRRSKVDLNEFDALKDYDRKYFELLQLLEEPMRLINPGLALNSEVSQERLWSTLQECEKQLLILEKIKTDDRLSLDVVHVNMINLYGCGILTYRWKAMKEVIKHYSSIENLSGKEALALFIHELEYNDFERSEKEYKEFFDNKQDVGAFGEWCHFYIRHGRIEKTKELYDSVFDERRFLIKNESEYFYREYILFYMDNKYNMFTPIKCYVEHETEFKDGLIKSFFKHLLNISACTFNNPDMMLQDAQVFLDEGIIDEKDYKDECLVINMLNCRPIQAEKFADPAHEVTPNIASPSERILYVWKGHPVQTNTHWQAMQYYTRREVERKYKKEDWHQDFQSILDRYRTLERREIVVDLWAIYYLAITGNIEILNRFRKIYISHETVSAALQEINAIEDKNIRIILMNFLAVKNLVIESPTIEQQLEIRTPDVEFREIHRNLLLAEIKNCAAFVGEFRWDIPDCFKNRVIRPNLYEPVANYMMGIRLLYGE